MESLQNRFDAVAIMIAVPCCILKAGRAYSWCCKKCKAQIPRSFQTPSMTAAAACLEEPHCP